MSAGEHLAYTGRWITFVKQQDVCATKLASLSGLCWTLAVHFTFSYPTCFILSSWTNNQLITNYSGGNLVMNISPVLAVSSQRRDLQCQHASTPPQLPTSQMIGIRQPSSLQWQSLGTSSFPGSDSDSLLNWSDTGDKCSCPLCKRHFHNRANMKRHLKIHLNDRRYKCSKCSTGFYRPDHLKLHESKCRGLLRTSQLPPNI